MAKIQVTQDGKVLVTQNGGVLLSNASELATKTITENGTYLASTDNVDGYSEVTVNVSSGGSGDDEYANYIQIENMIKGTSYVEADEIEAACDDISMFLYGTLHS